MLNLGMPEWMGSAVLELNAIGKAGYVIDVSPTVEQILERLPITFRQFVEDNKTAFA